MAHNPTFYILVIIIFFVCIVVVVVLWIQKLRAPPNIPIAPGYTTAGYGSRCTVASATKTQVKNEPSQFTPQPCAPGLTCVLSIPGAPTGFCKVEIGSPCTSVYECEPNATTCNSVCSTGQNGDLHEPCMGGISCNQDLTCVGPGGPSNSTTIAICLITPGTTTTQCNTSLDCANGTCSITSGNTRGYCIAQLPLGSFCILPSDCVSRNCSGSSLVAPAVPYNAGNLFCQPVNITTGNAGAICKLYDQHPGNSSNGTSTDVNTFPQCELGTSCYFDFSTSNSTIYGKCLNYSYTYPSTCSVSVGCDPPSICYNGNCVLPRKIISPGVYYDDPNSCDIADSTGQCFVGSTQSTSSSASTGCLCKPTSGTLIPANGANVCQSGNTSEYQILQWVPTNITAPPANTTPVHVNIGSYMSYGGTATFTKIIDFTSVTRVIGGTTYYIYLVYADNSLFMYSQSAANASPSGRPSISTLLDRISPTPSTPINILFQSKTYTYTVGTPVHVRLTPSGNIIFVFNYAMWIWNSPINVSGSTPSIATTIPFPNKMPLFGTSGATVGSSTTNTAKPPVTTITVPNPNVAIPLGYIDIDDRIGIRIVITSNAGQIYTATLSAELNYVYQDKDSKGNPKDDLFTTLTPPCGAGGPQILNVSWVKLYTYGNTDSDSSHFLYYTPGSGYVKYCTGHSTSPGCSVGTLSSSHISLPPNGNITGQTVTDFNAYFDNGTYSSNTNLPISNANIYVTEYSSGGTSVVAGHIQNYGIEVTIPGFFPPATNNLSPCTCISYPDYSNNFQNFNQNTPIPMFILTKTCT
jgi:hypothetical protein